MTRTVKKVLLACIAALILAVAGVYWTLAQSMLEQEPTSLLVCAEDETQPWTAWVCQQLLIHVSLTPERIDRLNSESGAKFPALMKNEQDAKEMLALFISRGVDVNAGHRKFQGLTALHGMTLAGNVERARLLIQHGARVDVRDEAGRSPLDFAQGALTRNPGDARAAAMVRLLEEEMAKQKSAQ